MSTPRRRETPEHLASGAIQRRAADKASRKNTTHTAQLSCALPIEGLLLRLLGVGYPRLDFFRPVVEKPVAFAAGCRAAQCLNEGVDPLNLFGGQLPVKRYPRDLANLTGEQLVFGLLGHGASFASHYRERHRPRGPAVRRGRTGWFVRAYRNSWTSTGRHADSGSDTHAHPLGRFHVSTCWYPPVIHRCVAAKSSRGTCTGT